MTPLEPPPAASIEPDAAASVLQKMQLGRAFGATRVLSEADAAPVALASQAKSTPADLVLETAGGTEDTLRAAGAALAAGGTVSVLGVFLGSVQLDPFPLLLKEAALAWSNCYARSSEGSPRPDFEDAVALVDRQRELLARLVTHSVPLGEVERGFAIASDKKAGAVKVSVLPTPYTIPRRDDGLRAY